ncbi:fumarylacetoacetate hydrolase family protein [Brackiella oedipodis]|uniref:fumarylacetoacetate hydrolase family protein n=1 Tax=Brackiella oedipodis TaxID=124225 RepID=UPI00048A5622|nr:fumarylacetoacetate hydrolase family protein [Brackiella oedipodis]
MTTYTFEPAPRAAIPVEGSEQVFPVRRIYCVGKNYANHVKEMGGDPSRQPPVFFTKASDAQSLLVVDPQQTVELPYPPQTTNLHYEGELVVALAKGGRHIAVEHAAQHIFGYAVGLDMTRRDLQQQMREAGLPWDIAKAFDYAAPIGHIKPIQATGELTEGHLQLSVNDTVKQNGQFSDMIWSVNETIAKLSELFELQAGDIIYTGTPEGVGPVQKGDVIHVTVDDLPSINVKLV